MQVFIEERSNPLPQEAGMASRSLIAYACVVQEDLIDRGDLVVVSLPRKSQQSFWGLIHVEVPATNTDEQTAQAVVDEVNGLLGTRISPEQVTLLFIKKPRKRNPKVPVTSPDRALFLVTYTPEQLLDRQDRSNRREWQIIDRERMERMSTFSWAQKKLLRKAKMFRKVPKN